MNRDQQIFFGFLLGWVAACAAVGFFQLLFL